MLTLNIKPDLKPLQRAFVGFHAKQAPFATALALTSLAKGVQGEEVKAIDATFETPTPFTEKSIAVTSATKSRQTATVFAKEIAAQYLVPYVVGGDRSLGGKRGMLGPRGVGLNAYGNLSKGKLAALKAKPNTFIGAVTFKNGRTVNGVWQRGTTPRGKRTKGGGEYGTKGKHHVVAGNRTTLKLLIQFEDTTQTRKHLPFQETAVRYVRRNAAAEYTKAMRIALATAR